jgi:hypothetical protein
MGGVVIRALIYKLQQHRYFQIKKDKSKCADFCTIKNLSLDMLTAYAQIEVIAALMKK